MEKSAPPVWVFITFRLNLRPDASIDAVHAALDEAVGRGTIQRLKDGHTKVKVDTLETLAAKLDCKPEDLLLILRGQTPVAQDMSDQQIHGARPDALVFRHHGRRRERHLNCDALLRNGQL